MDSSTYETLIFLFSIAFQHYLNYDNSPQIQAIKQEVQTARMAGERYKFNYAPPTIVFLPHRDLQKKAECRYTECHIFGWYSFGAGETVVYLSDIFEPTDLFTDPYVQSVYIHEATHYLQDKFGALRETCPQQWEIERNAYNTQFKYLATKHYANKIMLPTLAQVCGQTP